MNALQSTSTNQIGIADAFATSAAPAAPAFNNLISVLFGSPEAAPAVDPKLKLATTLEDSSASAMPKSDASPKDVANALIRSMFGGSLLNGSNISSCGTVPSPMLTSLPAQPQLFTRAMPKPAIAPAPKASPVPTPAVLPQVVIPVPDPTIPEEAQPAATQAPAPANTDATLQQDFPQDVQQIPIAISTPPVPVPATLPAAAAAPASKFTKASAVMKPVISNATSAAPSAATVPPPATIVPQETPVMHRDAVPARGNSNDASSTTTDTASGREQGSTRGGNNVLPENTVTKIQPSAAASSQLTFAAKLTPVDAAPADSNSAPAFHFTAAQNVSLPQSRTPEQPASDPTPASPEKPAEPKQDATTTTARISVSAGDAPATGRRDDPKTPVVMPATASQQIPQNLPPAFAHAADSQTVATPRDIAGTKVDQPALASDALRASDIQNVAPAPVSSGAQAQEISIRISQPSAPAVDLHVTERGGEIHVSVRTPDATLETALRQNLPTLTNSLERAGYHTETFVPQTASSAQNSSRENGESSHPDWNGRGGNNGGGSQHGRQQQPRDQREKSWIEALENVQ